MSFSDITEDVIIKEEIYIKTEHENVCEYEQEAELNDTVYCDSEIEKSLIMDKNVFDNDKFIITVQNLPALWNKSDPDYANKGKKISAWKMVLAAMYGEEELKKLKREQQNEIGKDIQKKWKSLRNSFAREMAKRKNSKTGSGKTWKTYMYFEQMSFLIPSMSYAESDTNFNNEVEEEIETEGVNEAAALSTPSRSQPEAADTSSRKRKKFTATELETDLATVLAKSLRWNQQNEEALGNDPDKLFLLSLLDDFKKVPGARKAGVKIGMINAITNGLYPQNQYSASLAPSSTSSHPYNTPHPMYPAISQFPQQLNPNQSQNITSSPSNFAQNAPSPPDFESQSSTDSSFPNLY